MYVYSKTAVSQLYKETRQEFVIKESQCNVFSASCSEQSFVTVTVLHNFCNLVRNIAAILCVCTLVLSL